MYTEHFELTETPFSNTLDPQWFHQSPTHEEALARLMFLVEQRRRCGVLLGPAGSGKSLILSVLRTDVLRLPCHVVLVDLLGRSGRELLWETIAGLGLGPRGDESSRLLWRILDDHLATARYAHAPTVLCYDHVDRAEPDCVTALERLSHTAADTGVTLVVSARNERVSRLTQTLVEIGDLRVELTALDQEQTQAYVETLLRLAGAKRPVFEPAAFDRIFAESRGLPRDINRLCDLALVAGMSEGVSRVSEAIVAAAAEQLRPPHLKAPIFRTRRHAVAEF